MRSTTVNQRPAVIELGEGEAAVVAGRVTAELERALDASISVEVVGTCLVLPAPFEIKQGGRSLPGAAWAAYAAASLAVCEGLPPHTLRYAIEEMYRFDLDRFDADSWATLRAAAAAQPEWIGSRDRFCWFGRDERIGPSLSAGVEPPGLQVAGLLELPRFEDWHRRFLAATVTLPVRDPDE